MRNQTGGKRMSGRTGSAGAKFLLRLLLGWFALASGLVWSAAADAQLLPYRNDIAPDRQVIDSRGVDVNLGEINVSTEPVGVGDLSSAASWSGITDFSKRSEEHTSELQSLMRISYAVFCLTNKNNIQLYNNNIQTPHTS